MSLSRAHMYRMVFPDINFVSFKARFQIVILFV